MLDLSSASGTTVVVLCLIAAAVAFVAGIALTVAVRRVARRRNLLVVQRPVWQAPLTVLLVVLAVRKVLTAAGPEHEWADDIAYVLGLALLAIVGWLLMVGALMVERALLNRYPEAGLEDRRSRHVRTKIILITRVLQAAIVATTVVAILWTIPQLREIGVGLLASTAVIGVIVGLAAQTSLGNLFAGVQIAFTDAIRIDDIVVVEGQRGRIEEITLTYVAIRALDNTTLILPCMYFTTTPFQNWTHKGLHVTGVVEIAADWRAPLDALREELGRLLERSPHWDGGQGALHVEDATGPSLRLVAVVTAVSGDSVVSLRREVREGLVTFLQRHHPEALPRAREESVPPAAG